MKLSFKKSNIIIILKIRVTFQACTVFSKDHLFEERRLYKRVTGKSFKFEQNAWKSPANIFNQ